jgi:predicted RNA-binding protein with PIN domain
MTTTILDGYNVIYAMPELARHLDHSLQAGREALVRFCQAYQARNGKAGKLYIVFDGRRDEGRGVSEQSHGRVTVVFARKPEEADKRILKVIEAQGRGRCVVVSDDNEVANNARAFGARIISVQAFYQQTQPVGGAPAKSAMPGKTALPARDARQITEDYRKHLERRGSTETPSGGHR